MLALSQTIINRPIMSLRTGGQIATAERPIINPNNLKIEGFYVTDKFSGQQLILLAQDLRDVIDQGLVVNDHEALTEPDDLVRLKDVLDINFVLIGKPVQTISKQKVGKVNDFAIDSKSLYIQKLYVGQNLLKSLSGASLSVDRTQINEITNRRVIINDLTKNSRVRAQAPATA